MFKKRLRVSFICMGLFITLLVSKSNCLIAIPEDPKNWMYVDFDASMKKEAEEYFQKCIQNGKYSRYTKPIQASEVLNFFRRLFDTGNLSSAIDRKKTQGIPKIIHQIWFGKMLERERILIDRWSSSWKKYHPDWEYKLWTEKDLEDFDLYNKDLFEKETYSGKANILRYEILYKFGGVYVDADFECFKSIDILNENYDFYCCFAPLDEGILYINNAIIASVAKHPILKYCIEILQYTKNGKSSFARSGTYPFTKSVVHVSMKLNLDNIMVFPASYFYPVGSRSKALHDVKFKGDDRELKKKLAESPEAFGIHYWYGNAREFYLKSE